MSRHNPKQKQIAVALPDDFRRALEQHAAQNGRSIAEEIRARLLLTFRQEGVVKSVRDFMNEMGILAALTRTQTGQDWQTHPGAHAVLRDAINARLARTKPSGAETFAPGELPSNRTVVGSSDPQTIGVALEAILETMLDWTDRNAERVLLYGLKLGIPKMNEEEEKNSDGT
jgi:plasmid stability protein